MSWIKQANIYGGPNSGIVALIAVLVLSICALSSSQLRKLGRLAWMWCVCYWVYLLIFFDPSSSILRMLLMMAPLAWVLGVKLSNHLRAAVAFYFAQRCLPGAVDSLDLGRSLTLTQ